MPFSLHRLLWYSSLTDAAGLFNTIRFVNDCSGSKREEADIEVVAQVAEAGALLSEVRNRCPDVLLLDAHMPGQNAIETAKTLCTVYPQMRILVLSAYDRREYVVGLLRAGASGYVLKDDTPEMLVSAVRAVAQGNEWLSPRILNVLMKSVRDQAVEPFGELTPRELEVLQLLAQGCKNEEVSRALVLSQQTVKNYVHSILSKLAACRRTLLFSIGKNDVNLAT